MQDLNESIFPRPLSGELVDNSPPGLVPARVNILGRHVALEPQDSKKHASELFSAGHGTEQGIRIWDYLAYGPWPNEDAYTATIKAQSASLDPIFYAIRCLSSNKACGQATFMDINPLNGVIEIGNIWFGPELQRTRGATEALYLMIKYAMDELGYRRMQWRCNSLNARSRAAAHRLGFRFEGVFYNNLIFKGKNRDTTWYSILDDEWPEVGGILEAWLDDSNFDSAGNARTSLTEKMAHRSASTRRVE